MVFLFKLMADNIEISEEYELFLFQKDKMKELWDNEYDSEYDFII